MIEQLQKILGEDSPILVFVSVVLICGTMVGTTFVTSSDLQKISEKISGVESKINELDKKVTSTSRTNKRLKKDISKIKKKLGNEKETRRDRLKDIRKTLNDLELQIEKLNSAQSLIEQRLDLVRDTVKKEHD